MDLMLQWKPGSYNSLQWDAGSDVSTAVINNGSSNSNVVISSPAREKVEQHPPHPAFMSGLLVGGTHTWSGSSHINEDRQVSFQLIATTGDSTLWHTDTKSSPHSLHPQQEGKGYSGSPSEGGGHYGREPQ